MVKENIESNNTSNTRKSKEIDISYEDFMKEYSEYNYNDYKITESNYYRYIDELFSNKYSKMIKCEFVVIDNDAFVIVQNNSNQNIGRLCTTIVFYDKNNQIIAKKDEYLYDIESEGKRITSVISFPKEYDRVDFYNELRRDGEFSDLKASKIKCEIVKEDKSVKATISNNNKQACKILNSVIIFYDESGKIIGSSYANISGSMQAEESKTVNLYNAPNTFDRYELIIISIK